MTNLSRAAQAKLAAEIQSTLPAPEWDTVNELKKWKEPITLKGGEKKALSFGEMVDKYVDLKAEIEYREGILSEIKQALEAALLIADKERVMVDGRPVSYVTKKGSRKIVPERLLENGVSAQVIAASTEQGPESHYVLVGKPGKD